MRLGRVVVSRSWLFLAAAVLISLAWGLLIPWEWSYVDEPGFALSNQSVLATSGPIGLIQSTIDTTQSLASVGRFRPAYAAFVHTYLLLGPALAHAGRLLMILVALGVLFLLLRRQGSSTAKSPSMYAWITLLFAANYTLFDGLYWSALSELTGVFLVSLALLSRNPYIAGVLLLLASLGKEAFVWLVIAYGIATFIQGRRLAGVIVSLAGLANAVVVFAYSRTGSYTSGAFQGMWDAIQAGAPKMAVAIGPWFVAFIVGMVVLRVRWRATPMSVALLLGGLGYLATVLLWGAQGYLIGPIAYLLTASLVRGLSSTNPMFTNQWVSRVFVAFNLALALIIFGWSANKAVERNALVVGVRDWSLEMIQGETVLAVNQIEAVLRVPQINQLHDPEWLGTVIEQGTGDSEYSLLLTDFGTPSIHQECAMTLSWSRGFVVPTICITSRRHGPTD